MLCIRSLTISSMAKKKKKFKNHSSNGKGKEKTPILTHKLKRWIGAVFMVVAAIILCFSFFEKAGSGGRNIFKGLGFVIGNTVYASPFLLVLGAFLILKPQKKRIVSAMFSALLLLAVGISGILASQDVLSRNGGWLGEVVAWPVLHYFGLAVAFVVFSAFILVGVLIAWEFLPRSEKKPKEAEKIIEETKEEKAKNGWFARKEKEEAQAQDKKPRLEITPITLPKKKSFLSSFKPQEEKKEEKPKQGGPGEEPTKKATDDGYHRPPIELFDTAEEKPSSGDTDYNASVVQKTLANFGISVEMSEVNIGPTVTQYTLKPAEGVKLSKITALNNDLALALASHPIRIEAPIPGRSLVGVEVPNKIKAKVKLGGIVASSDFQDSQKRLLLALGRDVMGNAILVDLDAMPHLLVAGATGSGKTICLNSLIVSLIVRNSPKLLRLILIDPKRVEFPPYSALPHLLTPVIFNARKAVNALNWLVGEMERRFEVLREFGARDIASYNKELEKKPKKKEQGFEILPYIVLIVDELADLMFSKGKEVEAAVVRLSQLSRAVGIHLVLATQRPSVEVITGLIKANITSRIAFQVASQVDARTILDTSGAEKLLGRGDMLFLSSEFSKPKRIQGSFVSTPEIKKVVDCIDKENASEELQEFEEQELQEIERRDVALSSPEGGENITSFSTPDELYEEAKEVVLQYHRASASLLQRRLQIGYARAARILDMLEENGIVGPAEGARPRELLVISPKNQDDDGYQDPSDLKFEKS